MSNTSTPTKGGKGGWTETEKIALLLNFLDQGGGIQWKNMKLPPGRTQKACMHLVAKMREQAKSIQMEEPSTATSRPRVANKAGPNKRKKAVESQEADRDDEDSTNESPSKKIKTSPCPKHEAIKSEEI